MKKKVILVAGAPACGKTYVSQLIARALEHVVYLDKDDLRELLAAAFRASGNPVDMDSDFYNNALRNAEYATILQVAFSALEFEDRVVLNAPFLAQVRDARFMRAIKAKANAMGAELLLVWVTVSEPVWYERMKARNNSRDAGKLADWEGYAASVDVSAPRPLTEAAAVDGLFIFDNENEEAAACSLKEIVIRLR